MVGSVVEVEVELAGRGDLGDEMIGFFSKANHLFSNNVVSKVLHGPWGKHIKTLCIHVCVLPHSIA